MATRVSVTKIFTFDAAHRLEHHKGQCQFLHGHTYKLEVTIIGRVKQYPPGDGPADSGMLIDFGDLKNLVQEVILDDLDHTMLNDVEWLTNGATTAESMVRDIFHRLDNAMEGYLEAIGEMYDVCGVPSNPRGIRVHKVRLWETGTSYAEVVNG